MKIILSVLLISFSVVFGSSFPPNVPLSLSCVYDGHKVELNPGLEDNEKDLLILSYTVGEKTTKYTVKSVVSRYKLFKNRIEGPQYPVVLVEYLASDGEKDLILNYQKHTSKVPASTFKIGQEPIKYLYCYLTEIKVTPPSKKE